MYGYAWGWGLLWLIFFLLIIPLFWSPFTWRRSARGTDDFLWRGYRGPYVGMGFLPYGRYTGIGPNGYVRSDERIADEINDRLTLHGEIDAREIQVQVKNGEVLLQGVVENRTAKRLAEEVADSVVGAKEVRDELRVGKLPPLTQIQKSA